MNPQAAKRDLDEPPKNRNLLLQSEEEALESEEEDLMDPWEEMSLKKEIPHADEFRSRSERAKIINYPKTTPERIVVETANGGYGYNIVKADLKKFGTRLPFQEAQKTIEGATRLISRVYCKVKHEEVADKHYCSYLALKVAICLVLASFLIF